MSSAQRVYLSQGPKLSLTLFPADPQNGYNFSFLLVEPKTLPETVKLFVEGPNTVNYAQEGQQSPANQIAFHIAKATEYMEYGDKPNFNMPFIYNNLGQPIIIPLIERCDFEHAEEFYTQMLGKNVMLDTESKFAYISDQVIYMIDAVKEMYAERGIACADKSGLLGASTSGVFAARMAFLEPENFDVCLSMSSNAVQPLPISEYEGIQLPYPLGTANYERITGRPFNFEEYSKIHQLFIVSEDEDNFKYDIVFGHPQLHDDETANIYSRVYGAGGIQDRQRMMAYIFANLGMDNTECVVAHGGHDIDESKRDIVLSWVKEVLSKPEIYKTSDKPKEEN